MESMNECKRGATDSSSSSSSSLSLSSSSSVGTRKLRITPMSWEEVMEILNAKKFGLLLRSEQQEVEYQAYRKRISREWRSIADFMLVRVFGFSPAIDEKTGKHFVEKDDAISVDGEKIKVGTVRLLLNDFPYFFDKGISHWCLWKYGGYVTEDEIVEAKKAVQKKLREDCLEKSGSNLVDVLHWTNPARFRSIPEIDHVHILSLKRNDCNQADDVA